MSESSAGEIVLANFESEDALYGLDSIPFLATSYGQAHKLYKPLRRSLDDLFAKQ